MRSAAVAQQQAGSSSFLILEIDLNYFYFYRGRNYRGLHSQLRHGGRGLRLGGGGKRGWVT